MNCDFHTSSADTLLCLHPDNEPSLTHSFRLGTPLGHGGSARVFRALRLEKGGDVYGTLKQFADGGPAVTDRLRQVCRTLRRLKQQEPLSVFIPYMVLYTDDEGRPCLFTPEDRRGITLAQYLDQLGPEPDLDALCQVLAAVCAAALAVWQMNRQRTLLLDIKPDNILLIERESPAGGKTYLQDSVGLFDIDSLLEGSPRGTEPSWLPCSPGFTAPELGGARTEPRCCAIGPASDVYALAATLFHALTGQLYPPTDCSLRTALIRGPFGTVLPTDAADQLAALLENALQYNAYQRMRSCAEFARRLNRILHTLRRRAVRQEEQERRELVESLPRMFAYLLYRWPCHEYRTGRFLRTAIVSDGDTEAVFAALNALLKGCQVLGMLLQITVAMPGAKQTVECWCHRMQNADRFLDTAPGPGWGECDRQSKVAQIRWLEFQPGEEQIDQLCGDLDAHYWLLLMRDTDRAEQLAAAWPEDDSPTFMAYTMPGRRPLYPRTSGTLKQVCLCPGAVDDVFVEEADRMAYCAHLLYERERDPYVQEDTARRTFALAYNRQASLETGLAVKCRLFSAGVAWSSDREAMARGYQAALEKNSRLAEELSWLEHRRWALSKLVQGARCLPAEEYSLLLEGGAGHAGTHLYRCERLYHAYLVPSAPAPRPEGWRTGREWAAQPYDAPLPAGLDPLDRVGIALHRMYAKAAAETDLTQDTACLHRQTERLADWLYRNGRQTAARALQRTVNELLAALDGLQAADPTAVSRFETSRQALVLALQDFHGNAPGITACESVLEMLRADSFCLVQNCRSPDPKCLDDTLIRNLPQLLGVDGTQLKGES